jgi:hypothetical protein
MRGLKLFLLFCLISGPLRSQDVITEGKEFWMGFLENEHLTGPAPVLTLRISSRFTTTGTVSVPLSGWTAPFSVTAGTVTTVTVPTTYMSVGTGVQNFGVRVVSADSVTVFASNFRSASFDATVVLPVHCLGYDYRIATYQPNLYTAEFLVAATEDDTNIEITPYPSSVPVSITLNAGQVYQFHSVSDLSGYRIKSTNCKRLAVFAGDVCTYVPATCQYCDHLYEQMTPVASWGTRYVIPRLSNGYMLKIMAAYDSTTVSLNSGKTIKTYLLNPGGNFLDLSLDSVYVLSSDKPLAAYQFAKGKACTGEGDPLMLNIFPLKQSIRSLTFASISSALITSHYAQVITKTSGTGTFKLNGTPVPAASFTKVPADTSYSVARISCAAGSNTLTTTGDFVAYIYGMGNAESYGYAVGGNMKDLSEITTSCVGDTMVLTAPPGESYLWSNGSTSRKIRVKVAGSVTYTVTVTSYACDAGREYTVDAGPCGAAVPLSVLAFEGSVLDSRVRLRWSLTSMDDLREVAVERKTGDVFTVIGTGDHTGSGTFEDTRPGRVNYYRLRLIRLNGSAVYSNVITITVGNAFRLLQHSVKRGDPLQFSAPESSKGFLSVYDSYGRLIMEIPAYHRQNFIDTRSLSPGLYFVHFSEEASAGKARFVIY